MSWVLRRSIKRRLGFLAMALLGEELVDRITRRRSRRATQRARARAANKRPPTEAYRAEANLPGCDLASDPLDCTRHLALARAYLGRKEFVGALAELKTAQFLAPGLEEIDDLIRSTRDELPPKERIGHNVYFRLRALSDEIARLDGHSRGSVLDVGGGHGELARFLPQNAYCLAEPSVNGISGTNLPFGANSFDIVVACHVLEHIPLAERTCFLDNLVSRSRKAVILLNPFDIPGTRVTERLELVIGITGAQWAKEHLECTLPTLDFVEQYAKANHLECKITPNGTLTTTLAMVFLDYFASRNGASDALAMINDYYNRLSEEVFTSQTYPTAYMCTMQRQSGG